MPRGISYNLSPGSGVRGGGYVDNEVFVILLLDYFKQTGYLKIFIWCIRGKEGVFVSGRGIDAVCQLLIHRKVTRTYNSQSNKPPSKIRQSSLHKKLIHLWGII